MQKRRPYVRPERALSPVGSVPPNWQYDSLRLVSRVSVARKAGRVPPREGLPDSVNDCSCSNALKPVGMLPDNRLPFAENLLPFDGQIHHVTDSRIVSTARIANTMAVQTYIRFVRALTEFGMVPVSRSDVSKRDLHGGTGSSQPMDHGVVRAPSE